MDSIFLNNLLFDSVKLAIDIHTAASIGSEERVRDLIENSENKAILDKQNRKLWTPLMYAACCTNLKVVLFLLEERVKIDLKNDEGHTALTLASKSGSVDIVNLLIDNGADVNSRDIKRWTALFYAVAYGHRSVVQLLIERGASFHTTEDDPFKVTPLMLAAAAGHETIVKDLLQLGVDVDLKSWCGDTAQSFALKNGHINVKQLIDAHSCSAIKNAPSNVKFPDLFSLLKNMELAKYYHIFESHDIDIHTFWLLTDENLKEIGIKLIGPRKKMCVAISRYHNSVSSNALSKDVQNIDKILEENKKLHQLVEKLRSVVFHEKKLRITAENSLSDNIERLNNYSAAVQNAVFQASSFSEKILQSYEYLRNILSSNFHEVNLLNNGSKAKIELMMQSLDCLQKMIDFQHKNILFIQKIELKTS